MVEVAWNDLLTSEVKRHPDAFFGPLREQEPLVRFTFFDGSPGWLATRYDDALAILKDPRFIKDRQKFFARQDEQQSADKSSSRYIPFAWKRDLVFVDPPDHTRLRRLVSKAFTPRMIEHLRPRIQLITNELLDAVQGKGKMDAISDFSSPLPITVISEMLGIPTSDREKFRELTHNLGSATAAPDPNAALRAVDEFFVAYIKALLAEKRVYPGDDLTSELVRVEDDGDRLNENELISMIWILIVGGHETTVNLLGCGTLALLEHPEQMRQLQQNPALLPSAVEELLRYTTPISLSTVRWASEDVTIGNQTIREGEMIFASLTSANSDRKYFDPDTLDITRQENKHIAFGKGIHVCLGAPLARLEGQIAFGTLLQRLPNLRLDVDPEQLVWNRYPGWRGIVSLPVAF